MANVFQKLLSLTTGEIKQKSQAAIEWYRSKASNQRVSPESMLRAEDYKSNVVGTVSPGGMFLFSYDPKHKETLPYYDTYPLVMPFAMESDGFIGLNLHYLPPTMRASLLSALMSLKPKNEKEKLILSYSILSKYSKLSYFKPCVKKYLYSHVKSKFLKISAEEWPVAIFLPLQRFQKASSGKVYADSRKMVGYKRNKK